VAIQTAQKASGTNSTVLLLGESGTGKEVFATRSTSGARGGQAFVVVNCVALSEHLLESELFGHEKGAFTGATRRRREVRGGARGHGLSRRDRGHAVEPADQAAAGPARSRIRARRRHPAHRDGYSHPRRTNRDLDDAVQAGRFRADLFYRLNVIRIVSRRSATEGTTSRRSPALPGAIRRETKRPVRRITAEAMDLLEQHPWPGNVRELANTIERAVVLCAGETITPADLACRGRTCPTVP